mmetsp:Transcript_6744/g.27518  ORF Transcript_6744/g.27518 Transcript_6744/m.27518 type:complete len:245 (-) Transcript_6744:1079-1813(-)
MGADRCQRRHRQGRRGGREPCSRYSWGQRQRLEQPGLVIRQRRGRTLRRAGARELVAGGRAHTHSGGARAAAEDRQQRRASSRGGQRRRPGGAGARGRRAAPPLVAAERGGHGGCCGRERVPAGADVCQPPAAATAAHTAKAAQAARARAAREARPLAVAQPGGCRGGATRGSGGGFATTTESPPTAPASWPKQHHWTRPGTARVAQRQPPLAGALAVAGLLRPARRNEPPPPSHASAPYRAPR